MKTIPLHLHELPDDCKKTMRKIAEAMDSGGMDETSALAITADFIDGTHDFYLYGFFAGTPGACLITGCRTREEAMRVHDRLMAEIESAYAKHLKDKGIDKSELSSNMIDIHNEVATIKTIH